jgi:DNA-binding response OmpR family regulator
MIDPKTFQVKRGRAVEELTAKELKLLQVFHAHAATFCRATKC